MNSSRILSIVFDSLLEKPRCCVNSQWAGHVPFMIALVQVIKPRSYVELGTHNGCSFFAACQGAELVGDTSEHNYLAIDSWEGDAHAGQHKTSVFKRFTYNIAKHFPWAKYRQDYFENVAPEIAADSIDLLHIDGLHTYEAVKSDFEMWSPKVKKGGVIIFHDTHEKAEGFGVWQLWDELKKEYETIEFPHSHGLGVLCYGEPSPELSELFRLMRDPDFNFPEVFTKASDLQNETTVFEFLVKDLKMKPRRLLKYVERLPLILKR